MTPAKLAKELNISPKKLRDWLRKEHARPRRELGSRWTLTPEMVNDAQCKSGLRREDNVVEGKSGARYFDG